ncbi:MAG: hypothetical protein LW845_16085 [Flammeovirgaceae bacterium]|nr:hypothetical protein [Flammeovirgaceae bacterium]
MKTLFKLFFSLISTVLVASIVASVYEVPVPDVLQVMAAISLVLFAIRIVALAKNPADAGRVSGLTYGVAVEFWESVIAEFIMKDYPWLRRAKDRLDEVSTNPTHIRDAEKIELTYDKVASVLSDHIKNLDFLSAYNVLFRWAGKNPAAGGVTPADLPAANIRRTSGTTAATHLSGATGNRKIFNLADFNAAKTTLINLTKREQNAGKRAIFMDETLYNQLKADTNLDTFDKREMQGVVMQNGDMVRIGGLDIIRTDVMPRFSNVTTPVAKDPLTDADSGIPYSASFATTDNACALLVDFDLVHIAMGDIKLFETLGSADYQGDIYSALVRVGASRERADATGVVAIVQEP